jgi:membrane protein DedA with SNARE-associated domain
VHGTHLHHFHGPRVDYAGVALAAAASWIGVSGPGEAALIVAGIAAAHHRIDIAGVISVAWAGAMSGGMAGWLIGHKAGRPLMTASGPLRRLRLRLLAHGDDVYARRGLLAVYFAPSWMAGISGMRAWRFAAANALSALVWSLLVGLGSYFAGPSIAEVVSDVGIIGVVVLAAVVVLTVMGRRRRRRRGGSITP